MRLLVEIFKDITLYGLEKIGLYYSQYRGWVFDNNDPKHMGRIQVNVPELYGDGVPAIWAWPKSNYSGPGFGMQCLPRKNDLIWVSFEKGNPRKPLWSYAHFTKEQVPEDLQGTKLYWFRTPSGITILIDDINKTLTVYEKDKPIQSMLLGETTKDKLDTLIDILKNAKINTQLGPQGFLPVFQEQLDTLKESLPQILSANNKLS